MKRIKVLVGVIILFLMIMGNTLMKCEAANVSDYASDLRYLSAIVWAEAGNQDFAGQMAVAIVVVNRVENELFPDTIYGVISQNGQFHPFSNGSFNKGLVLYDSGNMPFECLESARFALDGLDAIWIGDTYIPMDECLYFSRKLRHAELVVGAHQFSSTW